MVQRSMPAALGCWALVKDSSLSCHAQPLQGFARCYACQGVLWACCQGPYRLSCHNQGLIGLRGGIVNLTEIG